MNNYDLSLDKNKDIDSKLKNNEKIKELKQIIQNEKINGNVYIHQTNYFGKHFDIGIGKK